MATMIPQS